MASNLSLIVPAFNEAECIQKSLSKLDLNAKLKGIPYEIVVVDDGSQDNTLRLVQEFASRRKYVKIVSLEKNEGKGYALQTGFLESSGDTVVFVDSDMDIDSKIVMNYVDALKDGDIVIGSKWHPLSVVNIPTNRRLLSHSFNVLVRLLIGVSLKDTQAGLKAMKRSAFEQILPKLAVKRYAFDVELLAVAQHYGLKVVEMPTNLSITSSFKLKDTFRMFTDLLGIAYRLRVIHWYQRPISKNKFQEFISTFYNH